jgi:hypothetical protein
LVCPPPGAGRASIRRHSRVLPNRRRRAPSPLVARAVWAARGGREMECSMRASVWTSGR